MKIAVCIKSVPQHSVGMDKKTGNMVREQAGTSLNLYDYAAVEAALRIKERFGGHVTAFSMGPAAAETVLREVLALGADEAVLLSDVDFRGADVLATSYTISQALQQTAVFDFVFCGKQTTDGDTAQVPGALAAHLGYAYVPWVRRVEDIRQEKVFLYANMGDAFLHLQAKLPLVLSVEPTEFMPRTASLTQKLKSRKQEVHVVNRQALSLSSQRVGACGSPTRVVRVHKNNPKCAGKPVKTDPLQALALIKKESKRASEA